MCIRDRVLSELTKKGILVKAGTGVLMHREHWDRALNILREHLAANPQITLGEFRDLLGTSRKYAVMLLETYDQMKITKKTGDARAVSYTHLDVYKRQHGERLY